MISGKSFLCVFINCHDLKYSMIRLFCVGIFDCMKRLVQKVDLVHSIVIVLHSFEEKILTKSGLES